MGRRAHRPDPSQRKQVEAMAAYGIPELDIARVIGIDPKTLRKCYREELDLGETKANAQVAGFLFTAAKSGNVTAQIFWLKTRAKWREVPVELKHSGSIKSQLSHEEWIDSLDATSLYNGSSIAPVVGRAPDITIDGTASALPAPGS